MKKPKGVNLSKIPKHIWWGVFLPIVLVGLGIWRLWPVFVEYRDEDERMVREMLNMVTAIPISHHNTNYRVPEEVKEIPLEKHLTQTHGYYILGFCAWPKQYDWRHKNTFIINEHATIYSVDNGGKLITNWPTDEELAERFTRMKRE